MFRRLFLVLLLTSLTVWGGPADDLPDGIQRMIRNYIGSVQGTDKPAYIDCGGVIAEGAQPFVDGALAHPMLYEGVTWRTLSELEAFFGNHLNEYIASLPEGRMIILPGGGYSIYGLELFLKAQHHVVAVNASPYLGLLSNLLDAGNVNKSQTDEAHMRKHGIQQIVGVRVAALNRFAELYGVSFPDTIETPVVYKKPPYRVEYWHLRDGVSRAQFIRSIPPFVAKLLEKLKSGSTKPGSFHSFADVVQGVLPNYPEGTIDLIIDVADAFTYSSDRLELCAEYHRLLEPGRRAFINIDLLWDFVHIKESSLSDFKNYLIDGRPLVHLADYMTVKYPKVFKFVRNEVVLAGNGESPRLVEGKGGVSHALIIEKESGVDLKPLLSGLKAKRMWLFSRAKDNTRTSIPIVEYYEQ